jgi:DNA-binding SARP family transcriptional activator
MATLRIRLLGGFQLERDGQVLEQLPLRAARSLFAYLVLNRERPHTRDLLAGTFWPDFDDTRARRRLSQALWQIQTTIGEDGGERYLIGAPDTVRFNGGADFELDVDRFEALLGTAAAADDRNEETQALTGAVDLYRGDLLAGFYDDWLFHDQDRLRTAFLGALERLTDLARSRGDYETALVHARRLAQEDEFDEEAHRRVMRIAVLLGRHNEAIRQFEECRRILADELGTEPSAETVALYERTLADKESGGRVQPSIEGSPLFETEESLFIGREQERAALAERLDEVLEGSGGVVLLEGESGVGKTRLLAEVVEAARWRGMDVLWGRSSPSGGRPFAPLADALKSGITDLRRRQLNDSLEPVWRDELSNLLEPPDDVEVDIRHADEQVARMRESIARTFEGIAEVAPTLVVLEDVHWADDDTIQTLAQLAHRVEDDRLLFAVSYRHGEARDRDDVWSLLRTLDRMPNCERISLAPYSPAQTEELIRKSLGIPEVSRDFSERVHRETGGLPLFIVETLRAYYEQDRLGDAEAPSEESGPSADRLPLTPTVHALIRHRLSALSPGSQKTLEVIGVHDSDLTLAEIVDASALDDEATLRAIDDLVRRRLIEAHDGSYLVGHELMRRVVYDELSLSRRLDLHRRIALAVESHRPDEVELLAHHFTVARMPDRAAGYLERAARRALAVHAFDTAAFHLARASEALEEIGAPDERRFAVAALHEEVLDVLARREDQGHALSRMERYADEAQLTDVHRRRAWWHAHQDRFPEAEAEAHKALDMARSAHDGGRAVAALSTLGMIACFGGRAAEGVVHLEQAADYRGTDKRQEADARNALGQNLIDLQRFGEAESQLLTALRLYTDLEDLRGQAEVLGMLGTLRMERGEPDPAEADFERAIEISSRIGYRHGEAVYRMNLGILHIITNRLGAAIERLEEAKAVYADMGNERGRAMVLSNTAWLWHSRTGEDERARDYAREALEIYREIGDMRGQSQCIGLLGGVMSRIGDPKDAWSLFEESTSIARSVGDHWLAAQVLREWAVAELDHEQPARGLAHAEEAEAICNEVGMDDLAVGVRAVKGRLLLELGEVQKALEATKSAADELHRGIELSHLVAYAHALALTASGRHGEGQYYADRAYRGLMEMLSELPEETHESALRVPNHARIARAWDSHRPTVKHYEIASTEAPIGRPLESDEYVLVAWTISEPGDLDLPNDTERRRQRIVRLIHEADKQGASPTVKDLAEALDSSEATIRRDIAELRGRGHRISTRGSRSNT